MPLTVHRYVVLYGMPNCSRVPNMKELSLQLHPKPVFEKMCTRVTPWAIDRRMYSEYDFAKTKMDNGWVHPQSKSVPPQ